ncbi:MucBP domain-containing protein [Levilactobacillus bambusae]|uniref:MucBP domain-containing protein n=1 Tax=Levilactobacillus bambusae TaxID=2024736 RepID=A0A2V1MY34_9LACO|nr:MucBP domain-containing protein [Levilactobacillus bambusae]PWF99896.1 hypothetical protein DCM90_02790 [Levilactobacillus bambusae]
MAFFDWLTNFFSNNHESVEQDDPNSMNKQSRSVDPIQSKTTSTDQSVPLAPTQSSRERSVEVPTAILILLYETDDGQELRKPDVLMGHVGDPLKFHEPTIKGHVLVGIDGFTSNFIRAYDAITFKFAKQLGQAIMVYPIDIDTGQILSEPTILSGQLGEAYEVNTPSIENYTIIRSSGRLNGIFSSQSATVYLLYRRADWKTSQVLNLFGELTETRNVYDRPAGSFMGYGLPANSVWHVYQRVQLTDDTEWLNLGGLQWIRADNVNIIDHPLFNPYANYQALSRWVSTPITGSATVDYIPDKKIKGYVQPYGIPICEIPHGTKVQLIARIVDNQELVWYQLDNQSFVNARYLTNIKEATS